VENSKKFYVFNSQGNELLVTPQNIDLLKKNFDLGLEKLVTMIISPEKIAYANHTEIMQKLEWLDHEPSSDKGHFRFYPKGALIYNLLTEWCQSIAEDCFNALPVKTPFLYRLDNDAVKKQIGIFADSVYFASGKSGEKLVVRFNDDLGIFEIMKNSQLTHKHLPLRTYEHTPSFRYNKSGNLSGIRRGRYFSFTDIHSFCKDHEQGLEEYQEIHRKLVEIAKEVDIKTTSHFKVTEKYYSDFKDTIKSLISPEEEILIEINPWQRQYWAMKHIMSTEHPQKLFHVQLDFENSKRFKVFYKDQDDNEKNCVIVHTSLGSIEKWMIIILEDALKKEVPILPLWISPIQVRIIPVSEEKHLNFCLEIAETLKKQKIRVDIDDRKESLGKRIRYSEREWVPYVIVCGDKELENSCFPIRVRGEDQKEMSLSVLAELIKEKTKGMPFRSLQGLLLSKRPVFRGRD
jgi:threonyl-tRNA synthetase